ncbi:MAG: hypothetical protein H7138_01465 [Myxococcales bacterium]|nr:hypothetical protein [Myxococcales bacterium]
MHAWAEPEHELSSRFTIFSHEELVSSTRT